MDPSKQQILQVRGLLATLKPTEKNSKFSAVNAGFFMDQPIFFHDSFIHREEAFLSVRDLSFLRGYGVFDYFKTLDKKPLFLDDYLSRFYQSASAMHLPLPYPAEELKAIIYELLQRCNSSEDLGIRILLSGGSSEDSMQIGEPRLVIMPEALPMVSDQQTGSLRSFSYQREAPSIKSINYGLPIRLRAEGFLQGYTDVLYYSQYGITETSRCNVFLIKNGVIFTPGNHILQGVTRKQIILCAREAGFEVVEGMVNYEALRDADECFITSTTKGVLPIAKLDDQIFPSTERGALLRDLFRNWCKASL
jgi:branched-subunit amino acid aminotransferase/4-amino-4-deoxychorismate lyase